MRFKLMISNVLIALLSWQFFRYVDYVLNVITPESFGFDFAAQQSWASLAPLGRESVAAIINFVILTSVISLALTIFRGKRWTLVTAGVVGLVFIALFGANYINLIGVSIVALLFLYARFVGVEEIDQRTKINSRMIVRRGATGVVLAFFVLISFAAYQSPVAKGIAEAEQLPSATQQLMRSVVDSVIGSQVPAGPEKEGVISQITNETIQQFNNILKPYFQYAPPLLAFGLFLILWGLSWIFVWLSVLLGMLIFWILKRTKTVMIKERDVKAEVLII